MPVSKPSKLPRWSTTVGGTISNVVEPTSGKKDVGWAVEEKPPAQFLNWLFFLAYQWFAYLNDLAAQAWTWTGAHIFQSTVEFQAEPTFSARPILVDAMTQNVDASGWSLLEVADDGLGAGHAQRRRYSHGSLPMLAETINCRWEAAGMAGPKWKQDDATMRSTIRMITSTGFAEGHVDAGTSPWTDSDWVYDTTYDLTTSHRTLAGTVQGDLTASGVTAGAQLRATGTVSSATAGVGQGVMPGYAFGDTLAMAWGAFDPTGALRRGANIKSVTKRAATTGIYDIQIVNGTGVGGNLCVVPQVVGNTGFVYCEDNASGDAFTLYTFDASGVAANRHVSFLVYGGG